MLRSLVVLFSSASSTSKMAWRSHGTDNKTLVATLADNGVIKSDVVKRAMLAADRADFCLSNVASGAYLDQPLPIGHGATISAPHMHAHVLELLKDKLKPGAKVLDVGSGSGILLAYASGMVTPGGCVCGIEHIPELVQFAKSNLARKPEYRQLVESGTITNVEGDGYAGLPQQGPFDAIHVGAAAPQVPPALLEQLAPGGRLVIPVGKYAQVRVRSPAPVGCRLRHL